MDWHSTTPTAALIAGVHAHDAVRVDALLRDRPDLGARINEPLDGLHFGATILQPAIDANDRAMIDVLVAHGADLNGRTHWWAGGFGVFESADPSLVPFLLERGAAMTIHGAARLGRLHDVERLLTDNPSLVQARGGDGTTPLHYASTIAIAELLLARGAELDARDVDHESTPAQYLVREHPDVARLLVARGAHEDILMAAALGDVDRVRAILDADPAAVGTVVSERWFPMRHPKAGGTIYIWSLGANRSAPLIAHEFDHSAVFDLLMERSPVALRLVTLCELGDASGCDALLAEHPGVVETLGDDERARLPAAAARNDAAAVRLLLHAGWPVNAVNARGATALHEAAFLGNAAMTRELLAHDPDLEIVDSQYGSTPLGWARHGAERGWNRRQGAHREVIDLLLHAGAHGMDRD